MKELDELQVVILGSGTCVPTGKRGPAAVALITPSELVMLDAGSGSLEKLSRCGHSFTEISAVFLTHFHVDHTSELPLLLFANNYAPNEKRDKPLDIIGPPGLDLFMKRMTELYRWIEPKTYEIRLSEGLSLSGKLGEDLSYRTCQALHGDGNAISVRIDSPWGSITYSGDTGYHPGLVELAKETDLLIIEASFSSEEDAADGHLTPELAARVAKEAGAGKVVLTHLYPETSRRDPKSTCSKLLEVPVYVAHDFMRLTLPAT